MGDAKPIWYESVRNDVTGNWRELVIYSNKAMDKDLVIDYANAYISSEKEIHFVINLFLRTTTRISKVGNWVGVTVLEYTDGEEHDAKQMAGGDVLDSFTVDLETGELVTFDD